MGYMLSRKPLVKPVTVKNFEELKEQLLLEIEHVIAMDEVPADLAINFDQAGLNFVSAVSE